jgi:hypothetical protein
MTLVLASGADERYGHQLLNLIGSVKSNADAFDAVVAFDLGLAPKQRELLDAARGVDVRTVPPFVSHWAQGRTWKTWIWTNVEADELVWLDAGLTVLRPIDELLEEIGKRGYFVVSQGHEIGDSIPTDYYELYGFPRERAGRDSVAAGIIGFARDGEFYERVIVPTFEDCVAGRSLGFSPDEVARLNTGLDREESPPLRDCKHFRWDQTVLNLRLYLAYPDPVVNELDKFAGWRSAHDHPEQVIWSHRRHGSLAYLTRVPYTERAFRRRAFGLVQRWRWWFRLNRKYFSPSSYAWKARKLRDGLRARARRRSQR